MLSDTCHDCIQELLEVISRHDYCDDHKIQLVHIIRKLNEIRDELDHCASDQDNLLIYNKSISKSIVKKLYTNAQKKRTNSSVDFYDKI